jgi:hypothetical protein
MITRLGRPLLTWSLLMLLAACNAVPRPGGSAAPPPRPPVQGVPPTRPVAPPQTVFRAPEILRERGLEGVIEQDAGALVRQFGQPRLDVREGDMRKLQFSGQACVLDVFLYPRQSGAEAVATYVEARRASDGQEVGRAACISALRR